MLLDAQPNKPATVAKHKICSNNRRLTNNNKRRDKRKNTRITNAKPADTGTDDDNNPRQPRTTATRNRRPSHGNKPIPPRDSIQPHQRSRKLRKNQITGHIYLSIEIIYPIGWFRGCATREYTTRSSKRHIDSSRMVK